MQSALGWLDGGDLSHWIAERFYAYPQLWISVWITRRTPL